MIKNIKGLKFPDEYLVRFFYKEGLQNKAGSVIEFGCDNASNLQLFSEYGYAVTGIDLNPSVIEKANFNFKLCERSNYTFIAQDMCTYLNSISNVGYDVVLIPSSIYYLPKNQALKFLSEVKKILKDGSFFFLRMRDFQDYRYINGTRVDEGNVVVNFEETGEMGATMSFFTDTEFENFIAHSWNPRKLKKIKLCFENIQNERTITNSDFILYGFI